jgi:tetratricopeptide (TPR) repeat protein
MGAALALAEQLELERSQCESLAVELEQHPQARRLTIVANSPRFANWGLCEYLIERSRAARFDNGQRTLDYAELALKVSQRLDAQRYGRVAVADLRARTWLHVANARRIVSELSSAEAAFRNARHEYRNGTGDKMLQAELLLHIAELRRAQRRFSEALRLYDRGVKILRRLEEFDQAGFWLIGKALTHSYGGDPTTAIRTLDEALSFIDRHRDRRGYAMAHHNRAVALLELGDMPAALTELDLARPIFRELGDSASAMRVHWLEGRIALQLREHEVAETAFLEVREYFVSRGAPYDVALVSLDLALVFAEQARTADMKRLAAEMLPIFQALGIHREAIAALLVYQQAAEMETVSLGLIKELAAYFEKASKNPALPFRAPT